MTVLSVGVSSVEGLQKDMVAANSKKCLISNALDGTKVTFCGCPTVTYCRRWTRIGR